MQNRIKSIGAFAVGSLLLTSVAPLPAIGSGTERPAAPPPSAVVPSKANHAAELYEKGKAAVAAANYTEAVKQFEQANRVEPNNPDTLNMLAYSQRKSGKLDEAFANYGKALKLRPRFPEAREYLGEAHLQAVLREIETLKSYGEEGEEQRNELINALKEAAADQQPSSQSRSW